MPTLETLVLFATASLALAVVPGSELPPDFTAFASGVVGGFLR